MRPDEITLMAFADGELADCERDRVRLHLAREPARMQEVASFRIIRGRIERAFATIDFARSPNAVDDTLADKLRPHRRSTGARAHDWFRALQGRARQPAIHQALAASLTGVGVGWLLLGWALPPPATVFGGTESGDGRVIALGKVKVGTPLADALAKGSVGSDDGLGTTRLIAVADVDDKFGNPCREIEVFSSGDRKQPSAVVVACRHPGADEWVVVGASATTLPRDAAQRNYASSEAEALESVSGILSMIGARRRTTAREVESKTR